MPEPESLDVQVARLKASIETLRARLAAREGSFEDNAGYIFDELRRAGFLPHDAWSLLSTPVRTMFVEALKRGCT